MKKIVSAIIIGLLCFSTFSILAPEVKGESEVLSLPAGAWYPGALTPHTILQSINVAGQGQIATVSPGQTITISYTVEIFANPGPPPNPGEIRQAFFVYSWASSWPPWEAYTEIYNGIPGLYPGVTKTDSFSIQVPTEPGSYSVWLLGGSAYSLYDAIAAHTSPPAVLPHAKIAVGVHVAIKTALESLQSLEKGVKDGANIVDSESAGPTTEVARTLIGFIPFPPTTKVLVLDIVGQVVTEVTIDALLDEIVNSARDSTLYDVYERGFFSSTINMWKENVMSFNNKFEENKDLYSENIEFIKDMLTYHAYIRQVGENYPLSLNEIVDAHKWSSFQNDLIFLGGGIAIIIITWGAATPVVLAIEGAYNGVTGIYSIKNEQDFYKTLTLASLSQEADALYFASKISRGIEYLAGKLESRDLSFPKISVESTIPGGGGWIKNQYDKPVNVQWVYSVTLTCLDEQTIEPRRRSYQIPSGLFKINADSSALFLKPNPPPDVKRWIDHLKSFGYRIDEIDSLRVFYGDGDLQAMKSTFLQPYLEPVLKITGKSPINLLATAPNGLQVGYNSVTRTVMNEIEGAMYSGPGTEPQVITIPSPSSGIYSVDTIGTGEGTYTITIESIAQNGSSTDAETWAGTASPGKLDSSKFQLVNGGNVILTPNEPPFPMWIVGVTVASAAIATVATAFFLRKRKNNHKG